MNDQFEIKHATTREIPLILTFIKELAAYEKLSTEVTATEDKLNEFLFGKQPFAETIFGYLHHEPVCFAIFFYNFTTFLGQPGIRLEDLYVKPEARGKGLGLKMIAYLAHLAKIRGCTRVEWSVLDWNEEAIGFYKRIGATPLNEWVLFRLQGQALDNLASHAKENSLINF